MHWKHTDKPTMPPLGTPVMGMYNVADEGRKIDKVHAERAAFAVVMRGEDRDNATWYLPVTTRGKDQQEQGTPRGPIAPGLHSTLMSCDDT